MRTAAIVVFLWLCAAPASAQAPVEALYVSGQADFISSGRGGAGGIEWLRKTDRQGTILGVQAGSLADAWWTYGRAGGFVRWRRAVLSGTLDAGGGTRPSTGSGQTRFGYQKVGGELAMPVGDRLLVETEGQLARVAPDLRRILRLGVKWRMASIVTAGASYYVVSVGGSTAPAVSGRLDLERGRSSVVGGVVFARRAGSTALVSHVGGAASLTSTEFFGGGGFRARSCRLQVVANVAREPSETSRLLATLEIPLKR